MHCRNFPFFKPAQRISLAYLWAPKNLKIISFFFKKKSNNTRGFRVKYHVRSSSLRTKYYVRRSSLRMKIRWAKHRCNYCSCHLALRFPKEKPSLGEGFSVSLTARTQATSRGIVESEYSSRHSMFSGRLRCATMFRLALACEVLYPHFRHSTPMGGLRGSWTSLTQLFSRASRL